MLVTSKPELRNWWTCSSMRLTRSSNCLPTCSLILYSFRNMFIQNKFCIGTSNFRTIRWLWCLYFHGIALSNSDGSLLWDWKSQSSPDIAAVSVDRSPAWLLFNDTRERLLSIEAYYLLSSSIFCKYLSTFSTFLAGCISKVTPCLLIDPVYDSSRTAVCRAIFVILGLKAFNSFARGSKVRTTRKSHSFLIYRKWMMFHHWRASSAYNYFFDFISVKYNKTLL